MAVKRGYKQTAVGVIPEDWDARKLGQFVSLQRGHDLTDRDRRRGEVPVMGSAGQNGFHDTSLVKGPGVVLGRSGASFGQAHFCEVDFWPHNTALYVTDFHGNDWRFCFYFLRALDFSRHNSGGAQQSLNRNFIAPIPVAVPLLPEQRAIAEALSDADALLESLEQLAAKKRQLKQGTMQELLRPKDGWEPTGVGNVADPNQRWSFTGGPFGSNLKSSDYTDEGVQIIQLQDIGDGEFKDESDIYTSTEKADELLSCNIYPGEIILSKMGDPVARACIVPPHRERYLMCSDGIRLAVDQKRFDTYFVYTVINAPDFRVKAANAGTGSTRKRIGLSELRNLELLCPSLPEQAAIAEILSDMDNETTALETRRDKTRALKQGIMQELLTGRIRLI